MPAAPNQQWQGPWCNMSSGQLLHLLFRRLSFRHDHLALHLASQREEQLSCSCLFLFLSKKLRFCCFTQTNTDCVQQHSKTIHNMMWPVIFVIKSRSCEATDAKFIAGRHRTIQVEGTCYTTNVKASPICKFVTCRLSGVSSRFVTLVTLEVYGVITCFVVIRIFN